MMWDVIAGVLLVVLPLVAAIAVLRSQSWPSFKENKEYAPDIDEFYEKFKSSMPKLTKDKLEWFRKTGHYLYRIEKTVAGKVVYRYRISVFKPWDGMIDATWFSIDEIDEQLDRRYKADTEKDQIVTVFY